MFHQKKTLTISGSLGFSGDSEKIKHTTLRPAPCAALHPGHRRGFTAAPLQGAHQVRHRGVHRGLEPQLGRLRGHGAVEAVDLTGTTRLEVLVGGSLVRCWVNVGNFYGNFYGNSYGELS